MGKIYIGIDPGVKTGVAIWNSEIKHLKLYTLNLHTAFKSILKYIDDADRDKVFVRIEDARLRKFFGKSGREVLQGAGSIKRDCSAWQEFLEDNRIQHEFISPKQKGAKLSDQYFKKLTGYTDRCSQHARDAGILVYGI